MTGQKPIEVKGFKQKGRKKTVVKEHERKGRKKAIEVQPYTRARRRTKDEIDKYGTRKDPKIKPKGK